MSSSSNVDQLIAENRETQSPVLDLSNCGLREIPPEICELTWLQSLRLSYNRGIDVSMLASLSLLQSLNLRSTQISDLSPLQSISSLQSLYLMSTQVSDLSPLQSLSSLQLLDLSGTRVSDLGPLQSLSSLQSLYLSGTQVRDLSPLQSLRSLRWLNLSGTKVRDLSPLQSLSLLQLLNIMSTEVSDLSSLLSSHLKNGLVAKLDERPTGSGIFVRDCPLVHPPLEIVAQGHEAVLNYFREIKSQGVDHLYEAKLLVVGEGGVGKTSLIRRLYFPGQPLPEEKETTKGIDIYPEEFSINDNRQFRLNVWDFGGQEIYHATHQFFLTKRSLYVLLDNTRTNDKTVTDPGFKYWLEVIDVLSDKSPVLIFQNEKGGRSKEIDQRGIKGRFDNVQAFYRGNLIEFHSADELRNDVQFYVQKLPHVGDEVPAKWVSIRNEIETVANEKPYILEQEYFDIYGRHLEFDREKALFLSDYFHDLGVYLHFQDHPLLRRVVILQNEWATEAVFRILDYEAIKQRQGYFTEEDCKQVWVESSYAAMYPELLALMERFELCYSLPHTTLKTWLAPQLLSSSKPETFNNWENVNDLVLSYRYEFMPKGLISRLMVRMNRYVKQPDQAWINGVLFEREKTELLVQLMPKGDEIMLRARGSENKTLLSAIAEDLDALNAGFAGLADKVAKRVPCKCSECKDSLKPYFFEQRVLLRRRERNQPTIECQESGEDVSVIELLDGLKLDVPPSWKKDDEQPSEEPKNNTMKTIKIFIASSSELSDDRDAFELYFRQQNDSLMNKGLYLKIVRWENFLDAMGKQGLQAEYNQAVRDCDIFVSLFMTKTGKYTEEEFEVAHKTFMKHKKPLIYTYFKQDNRPAHEVDLDDRITLRDFQKKLSDLKHYYTSYDGIEDLKRQFKDQLEKLQEAEKI